MATFQQILKIVWLSMIPIGELRVSIPVAIFTYHWSYWQALLVGVLGNLVFIWPLSWCLDKILLKWVEKKWLGYQILNKFFLRAATKVKAVYSQWAKWGLAIFVGIPLPLTGAWTGTVGARLLGLSRKDTTLYVGLGVVIAGIIVTLASFLVKFGIHLFFIKIG